MRIGESFVGSGVNAAHVNTVLGRRDGPVGAAWATSLATPTAGHARFVVVARPGVAVQPFTLFVNKAFIGAENATHARMTWGPAQAGVAAGVGDAIGEGVIDRADVDSLVLIAAVWVDPDADDAGLVYANNRAATTTALRAQASVGDFLAVADEPANPFFSLQDDD